MEQKNGIITVGSFQPTSSTWRLVCGRNVIVVSTSWSRPLSCGINSFVKFSFREVGSDPKARTIAWNVGTDTGQQSRPVTFGRRQREIHSSIFLFCFPLLVGLHVPCILLHIRLIFCNISHIPINSFLTTNVYVVSHQGYFMKFSDVKFVFFSSHIS